MTAEGLDMPEQGVAAVSSLLGDEHWETHRRLTHQIQREAQTDPHSQYAGKWVALFGGEVIAIADTAEQASEALRAREPQRRERGAYFQVGVDYETVQEIWET